MNIEVLASGSSGNAYLVSDGKTQLLLDCGIPFSELKVKTYFFSKKIDACLISHSHKDHVQDPIQLMNRGIPCFMSSHTLAELNAELPDYDSENPRGAYQYYYRAVIMKSQEKFSVGTFDILPLELQHDVYCLGFYIYSREDKQSLFFATDTCCIPYSLPSMDYIMVEANYDIHILNKHIMDGYIDPVMKRRLAKSHMEIGNTIKWLEKQDFKKTRRIYLLHLSNGSSNAEDFKNRVIEVTGVPVRIA